MRLVVPLPAFLLVCLVPSVVHATCLTPEHNKHGGSSGFWINHCNIGINVIWYNEARGFDKRKTCRSRPGTKYPCSGYVRAFSKKTANVWGRTVWAECESRTPGEVFALESNKGTPYCSK